MLTKLLCYIDAPEFKGAKYFMARISVKLMRRSYLNPSELRIDLSLGFNCIYPKVFPEALLDCSLESSDSQDSNEREGSQDSQAQSQEEEKKQQ